MKTFVGTVSLGFLCINICWHKNRTECRNLLVGGVQQDGQVSSGLCCTVENISQIQIAQKVDKKVHGESLLRHDGPYILHLRAARLVPYLHLARIRSLWGWCRHMTKRTNVTWVTQFASTCPGAFDPLPCRCKSWQPRDTDTVVTHCCRPISKRKAWVVTEIIRREKVYDPAAAAQAAAEQVSKMQQARQDQSLTSRGFAASAIK